MRRKIPGLRKAGVFITVFQRNSTRYIEKCIHGDFKWELAHTIMKAEKASNVPCASWKTRNTSGIILYNNCFCGCLSQSVSRTTESRTTGKMVESLSQVCFSFFFF
jgi:hypothetical protein